MSKKVEFTVSHEELRVLNAIVEQYARAEVGQFFDYVDEIAEDNEPVYDSSLPNHRELFDNYISRRNEASEMLDRAYRYACPKLIKKSEEVTNAFDMYITIRHNIWKHRPEPKNHEGLPTYPPTILGTEPMLEVKFHNDDCKIICTGHQARIINSAIERYIALRNGDFSDYVKIIAVDDEPIADKSLINHDDIYNAYLERAKKAENMFVEAYQVACPNHYEQTEDMITALKMKNIISPLL